MPNLFANFYINFNQITSICFRLVCFYISDKAACFENALKFAKLFIHEH